MEMQRVSTVVHTNANIFLLVPFLLLCSAGPWGVVEEATYLLHSPGHGFLRVFSPGTLVFRDILPMFHSQSS